MTIETIEMTIAGRVVDALMAAGYTIGVNDGCDTTVRHSTDRAEIMGALASTGEDYVIAYDAATGKQFGWVWLVWGNDEELITDHTVALTSIIDPLLPE
jgi:hypothetical protein